jgi:hypothetical protein
VIVASGRATSEPRSTAWPGAAQTPAWAERLGAVAQEWLPVALLFVLGAALRLATLGHQSLGHDEAVTVGRVLQPSLRGTLAAVGHSERTPYLYYVLAWLWTRAAGVSAVGLRSLSALAGTLCVPVAFIVGRRAMSRAAGVLAAAFVAVDPFLVYYSQEARAYSLLALLTLCTLWAFVATVRAPAPTTYAAWAIASALALATHYFALFMIGGEAVCLLLVAANRRHALLAMMPAAVVGIALIPLVAEQVGRQGGGVGETSPLREIPTALVQFMFGERLALPGLYALTPLLGGLALVAATAMSWRLWQERWRQMAMIGAVGVAAIVVSYVVALGGVDFFNARNGIGALMALIILLAGYLVRPYTSPWSSPTGMLLLLAGLVVSVVLLVKPSLQRPDFRDAAALLGTATVGQRALVISPGGDTPTLLYRALHDPANWPAAGARVVEIDVLGTSDAAPRGAAPNGFHVIATADEGTVRVTRLRADPARHVLRATLESLAPDHGHPTLLLETLG